MFVAFICLLFNNKLSFSSSILKEGQRAPNFKLFDESGIQRKLSDYKGSYVVLYFYPKDDTAHCTKEACSIRDDYSEFRKKNIIVLGVSYDSPEIHKLFKQKHNLPFILLSDSDKSVAQLYGAKRFLLPYPKRKTFIVNPGGFIYKILDNIDVSNHASEILDAINKK
jgi:thioredoxin-dependent peroxiredoxin